MGTDTGTGTLEGPFVRTFGEEATRRRERRKRARRRRERRRRERRKRARRKRARRKSWG